MTMYNFQSSPVQSSPVQSIIIPTYNRKDMLAEAIDSVLKQSLKDIEVIVIDDCSADGTSEFVKSIPDERVRCIRNDKNSGQEASRMYGLRLARGKYITFLDDDDYYTDYEFFEKAVKIHEEHEGLTMVYANADIVNTLTHETRRWDIGTPGRANGVDDFILGKYRKAPSTFPAVCRADILRLAGFEDKIVFDGLLYIEASLYGDLWVMPDIIGVYRIHGESAEQGYKDKNPDREARHWRIVREATRRWQYVRKEIRARKDKKTADDLFVSRVSGLFYYFGKARPGFPDRVRALRCILGESGFMPKLWLKLIFRKLKSILRKITPLRKIYRFIKYRLRGRPYPED